MRAAPLNAEFSRAGRRRSPTDFIGHAGSDKESGSQAALRRCLGSLLRRCGASISRRSLRRLRPDRNREPYPGLRRSFQGQRLTLKQHRKILTLAGWIALLIACVEYDTGDRQAAETTRQAALSLGREADHAEITAWAHEIQAWIAVTTGNYHGVVTAARAGIEAAPHHSVAIQLSAQEAKAWARLGDRRLTEVALDKGRRLLEAMPYPENLDHHFVVDPTKFDFYAMDCYRHLVEDRMAETLANEVIQASTDFDGTERAPMRLAEARITMGVVAARQGTFNKRSTTERTLSALRGSPCRRCSWSAAISPRF
jgi:hypothetical protein